MTLLKHKIFGILLLFSTILFAQETSIYTNKFKDYQKALTLYNNQQYKAAQSLFDDIKYETEDETLKSDCSYYIANCAVRLNQKNADDLIESSKTQAAEIIANADKQASVMIDNAKGAASEEADKIKEHAKSELDQEVVKARNELKNQVSTLVMQGVNSVLDKEVDSKTHKDMLSKLSQSL